MNILDQFISGGRVERRMAPHAAIDAGAQRAELARSSRSIVRHRWERFIVDPAQRVS